MIRIVDLEKSFGPLRVLSTGVVRDAVIQWRIKSGPPDASGYWWSLPVVGETWDGRLNDINGFHVRDAITGWRPITGVVSGALVMLVIPAGCRPVELAYAWAGYQLLNLVDQHDLPAWPARRPVLPSSSAPEPS